MAEDVNHLLQMVNITKRFPGVTALDSVNLAVREGEIHAICGENGAGKSTLMKVLSGVYPAGSYEGEIVYRGEVQRFGNIAASENAGIVIIHQELALVPELSITENIFLGHELNRLGVIDWDEARRRTAELLQQVDLNEDPDTPVKYLGVGKQQLVEIAKALEKDVQLLILDEPTAALNERDSQHLLRLITGLRDRGVTSIMISHKLGEIEQIADTITIIRDGKTIETLAVDGTIDEDRIIRGMVGRTLGNRFPDRSSRVGEVFFEVRDWTVQHPLDPSRLVAKNAAFTVRRGEIVGFAGLMGAGRTELAMSVFGNQYGTRMSGEAFIDGRPVKLRNVKQAISAGLAYVSEDRKSLGLNLLDPIKRAIVSAKLSRISTGGVIDELQETRHAEEYRRDLRIKAADVEVGVDTLSGGNQQKVVLAKWMFSEPELLILDEPTRGIDVGAKAEIYQIMRRLAESGKGIVLISSELPELIGMADRIYTIFEGEITAELDAADVDQETLMRHMAPTKKGSAA
ncbi:multiple monosaccharide ABC transporter ATP-binding protein [Sediminivirga luteola]|uniref:Xylose ABC transporter ATP-binding protein n=1 Tax=Sediminivirga luteola TaxID=1774748 RepID=A0A8J2XM05_9MICO|nr:multiple monosaccharide ABC transporter ATP-binding protein [Sediminivirga luteola]MCI2264889.1 sugar ABC transporter ATP-binding protein [Sediminivirga luteola]GGA26512.1 xylose ABC transporter ATP-binding protein [Sediminivirga luteola]